MKDGKIIENDTTEQLVRLVDGKIWECKIPSSDLVKWERALKLTEPEYGPVIPVTTAMGLRALPVIL